MKKVFYLFSVDQDKKIFTCDLEQGNSLNKNHIKEKIKSHLNTHPTDTLEWTLVNEDPQFVGDEILDFYEVHNYHVCQLVLKGNKEFYKKL